MWFFFLKINAAKWLQLEAAGKKAGVGQGLVLIGLCWSRNVLNVSLECFGLGTNWARLSLSAGPYFPCPNYCLIIVSCDMSGSISFYGRSCWELSVWWLRQCFCWVFVVVGLAGGWGFLFFFPKGSMFLVGISVLSWGRKNCLELLLLCLAGRICRVASVAG